MAFTSPVIKQAFYDLNGDPLVGGKLYTYEAGTSTPKDTYTDALGASLNTNPIITDSRGECDLFIKVAEYYKFVLKDANDVLIWSKDNISTPFNPDAPVTVVTNDMLGDMAESRMKGRAKGSGTGSPVDLTPLQIQTLLSDSTTDSATTGDDQTLPTITTKLYRLTNASLNSIDMINQGYDGQVIYLENASGKSLTLKHNVGATAARRILTPSGVDFEFNDKSIAQISYSAITQRWFLTGGGGGSGLPPSLAQLTDVDLTGLTEKDILSWNNSTLKWERSSRLTVAEDAINDHETDETNPHNVTKAQVGLANVDNTADTAKPVSTAQQTALDLKVDKSTLTTKGDILVRTASGVARLPVGSDGKVLKAKAAATEGVEWTDPDAGGGSGLSWYIADGYSGPMEDFLLASAASFPFASKYLVFPSTEVRRIFTKLKLDASYITNSPIKLNGGKFRINSSDTSKDVLFTVITRLVKPGDNIATLANSFEPSSNSTVQVQGTANLATAIGTMQLNNVGTGKIDGRDCTANDEVWLILIRNIDNENNSAPEDVYLSVDADNNAFSISYK